jgi:hypothetical protein
MQNWFSVDPHQIEPELFAKTEILRDGRFESNWFMSGSLTRIAAMGDLFQSR